MITALSSAVAPRATLQELADGCARRGITALHLVQGHAHGVRFCASSDELLAAAHVLNATGVRIAVMEIDCLSEHEAERAAEVCALFGAKLMTACTSCMVVNAAEHNVDEAARGRLGDAVDLIVLQGAGPEAAQHEGRGIGSLMTRLTLSGYQGILTLAPSSAAVLPVWRTWLQHGRNWGCGSKTADPSLVQLAGVQA
jgi:hypothetical protein